MIVAESRGSRRLVGRLDRGVDLFDALLEICKAHDVHTAEIRALGSLEAAELAEYDQARRTWKPARAFSGGFEVLNLTGNVSEKDGKPFLHAHVSLMRDRDSGIELLGGHLVSARVFALEFVFETLEGVSLRRGQDPMTGLTQWMEASAAGNAAAPAAPAAPAAKEATWAQVVTASRAEEAAAEEEAESIQPGDVIDHPRFGRGTVQRVEGAHEFVHVRLPNGRLVRLALDVLKLRLASREDGRRVFRARIEG